MVIKIVIVVVIYSGGDDGNGVNGGPIFLYFRTGVFRGARWEREKEIGPDRCLPPSHPRHAPSHLSPRFPFPYAFLSRLAPFPYHPSSFSSLVSSEM